jgi:DNA-binding MarR family transcriptional regulator
VNEGPPLLVDLLHTAHALQERLDTAFAAIGLSAARQGVLDELARADGPLALGDIAARQSCVRSNMTQLVDRLEAERLVERVSDPGDRRSVRAALTDLGRLRYTEGSRILAEAEGTIFAGLGDAERTTLARLVRQVGQET